MNLSFGLLNACGASQNVFVLRLVRRQYKRKTAPRSGARSKGRVCQRTKQWKGEEERMLSRVADNLYWMSRYLERAEHTARLIDVDLQQMLGLQIEDAHRHWERLRICLHAPPGDEPDGPYSITQALTFDTTNSSSIVSCIAAARENARQVREQISSEMWEQVNRLYLQIKRTSIDEIWYAEPHSFLANVKEGVQLFQGITDATMTHSEGWDFIRLGRFIERAIATATLIDVRFSEYTRSLQEEQDITPDHRQDYMDWVGLLRSCAAFESYCKVYTANIQPDKIAEFLLLNAESPRSVRFAAAMIQGTLQAIARMTNTRPSGRVERLAGRLRAALDYDQIEDIMSDMHTYLENIKRQCTQIHNAIYQVYVVYPIDVALVARGAGQA
jgi:uncharacterized alpha-E superfamily protein